MQYQDTDRGYMVVINKGENLVSTLTEFAKEKDISNAVFRGIGAVESLTCGYYDLQEKEYHFHDYEQMLEVVSMIGNVMLKDDEPFIHVHGVFTDETNNAFGGHVKEMTVGVTLEVYLETLDSKCDRQLNEEIGLFLINCPYNN